MFLLVGATFTVAYVQGQRGHIGIEAFTMSPVVNCIRLWLVDVASLLFCAFFAWKSWTCWRMRLTSTTAEVSNSMWSPPLAIPYAVMAVGMTRLLLVLLLQIIIPFAGASCR